MKTKNIDDVEKSKRTRDDEGENDSEIDDVEETKSTDDTDDNDSETESVEKIESTYDEDDNDPEIGDVEKAESTDDADDNDSEIEDVEKAESTDDADDNNSAVDDVEKSAPAREDMTIEEMIVANRADCNGCEACANICPKNAIKMIRDAEGFAYPNINHELCIKCGRCSEVCPALNFAATDIYAFPPTFAAIYPNEKILRQSSAGGVFTALSEFILKNGGFVFGAGFDKNWRVRHAAVRAVDKLKNLRGMKYVQSKIGDIYGQVKNALAKSLVLFSGTPCQCAGLKHFLGGDFDNLLTVEIICRGMPSPALWESYIDRLGYAHDITSVNFRSKRNGWGQRIDINFADQEHRASSIANNIYGRLFRRNLSLRPSCSACKFKFPNGQADLTLGDAWGIKDFAPEFYDERGVSLVFVHTQKGANVLEQANLKLQAVSFPDALKENPFFISSALADSRREKFFGELAESGDWYAVMQKYFDKKMRQETQRKNKEAFEERFTAITAQVRQKFEKNILVVFTPAHESDRKNLGIFFERNFKNSGVYLLEPGEGSTLTCTESFSQIISEFKDTVELSDFVKQRNITEIFVKLPLDFRDGSPAMIDWLNNCGLPAKTFAQK